ncbi:MAG: DUF128 domain-containing protein [Nitrospirae bacterium]|nr:MAG: DUF128 domain-containing protein [Nitrospirota bacterium]
MNKTLLAILKVLNQYPDRIVGSREISRQLTKYGVKLSERTVRYHLRILDERGLTEVFGKEGRKITDKGRRELGTALVSDRVGFVISKIDTLSYLTSFDIDSHAGEVILNVSFIKRDDLDRALRFMSPVFSSPYVMSDRVALFEPGEKIGDMIVPDDSVGIGTVCSVTINGIFLKAGIPVHSRFGGVLEVTKKGPSRFVALIGYEGSSLDPLEVFIRGNMTDVHGVVKDGAGRVLASFREVPVVCYENTKVMTERLTDSGIGGILALGEPNTPLFEMPVGMDRFGMVVVGGLNPIALLEERGLNTESKAMSTLYPYEKLERFRELKKRHSD